MTNICLNILFIKWSFSFLSAIPISKAPGHYINHKIQYSTARTAVGAKEKSPILRYNNWKGNKNYFEF